jgi:hypothetical protein
VNAGNDRDVFPWESLTETYSDINITETWKALQPVMKKSISLNGITLLPWSRWLGYVRTLQSLY